MSADTEISGSAAFKVEAERDERQLRQLLNCKHFFLIHQIWLNWKLVYEVEQNLKEVTIHQKFSIFLIS